jgi:hypothetical protein
MSEILQSKPNKSIKAGIAIGSTLVASSFLLAPTASAQESVLDTKETAAVLANLDENLHDAFLSSYGDQESRITKDGLLKQTVTLKTPQGKTVVFSYTHSNVPLAKDIAKNSAADFSINSGNQSLLIQRDENGEWLAVAKEGKNTYIYFDDKLAVNSPDSEQLVAKIASDFMSNIKSANDFANK